MKFGRFICVVFAASIFLSFSLMPLGASADDAADAPDWMSQGAYLIDKTVTGEDASAMLPVPCAMQEFEIPYAWGGVYNKELCVMEGKSFFMAVDQDGFYAFIRYKTSDHFQRFVKDSWSQFYVIPREDSVIHLRANERWSLKMMIYNNFLDHMHTSIGSDEPWFDYGDADYPSSGVEIIPRGWALSENNRYIVMGIGGSYQEYDRIMRIDLSTGLKDIIGSLHYNYVYNPLPSPGLAISNDGQLVFAGGIQSIKVWNVRDGCGKTPEEAEANPRIDYCPNSSILPEQYDEIFDYAHSTTYGLSISDDKKYLSFYHKQNDTYNVVRLAAGNVPKNPKQQDDFMMKYLALGDSYSSGEGDISNDGKGNYIDGTDVMGDYNNNIPREKCHVSIRAYPYLLAQDIVPLSARDMHTVACSGARTVDVWTKDDYIGKSWEGFHGGDYYGQATQIDANTFGPRLFGIDNVKPLQESAMNLFVPGRLQQSNFVKKYKPEVVTIGISGNDLGFGDILSNCVLDITRESKINFINEDCEWTTKENRNKLGAIITNNYEKVKDTLNGVRAASPNSTVYLVGYPKFLSSEKSICWNMVTLTKNERELINNAIDYTNQTLRQAASATGARFIDITDALEGKNICGASTEMTDPIDFLYAGLITAAKRRIAIEKIMNNHHILLPSYRNFIADVYMTEMAVNDAGKFINSPGAAIAEVLQSTFHPNAKGHEAIYEKIKESIGGGSLLTATCDEVVIFCPSGADTAPKPPVYFGDPVDSKIVKAGNIISSQSNGEDRVERVGSTAYVRAGGEYVFSPPESISLTSMSVYLYSDPIFLGIAKNTSDDRPALTARIPEGMSSGFHILSMQGSRGDGASIEFVQQIFVEGPSYDLDNDGIDDTKDGCLFYQAAEFDKDHDGIYDSCDLAIEERRPDGQWSDQTSDVRAELVGLTPIEYDDFLFTSGGSTYSGAVDPSLSVGPGDHDEGVLGIERTSGESASTNLPYIVAALLVSTLWVVVRWATRSKQG